MNFFRQLPGGNRPNLRTLSTHYANVSNNQIYQNVQQASVINNNFNNHRTTNVKQCHTGNYNDFDVIEHMELSKYDEGLYSYPTLAKEILYKNATDPLIIQLNNCASLQQVFDHIENTNRMNAQQLTQTVLILGDFQKLFVYAKNSHQEDGNANDSLTIDEYNKNLIEHKGFVQLLAMINREMPHFDHEALSWIIMSLNKLGISARDLRLFPLIRQFMNNVPMENGVKLGPLSRLCTAIGAESRICSFYLIEPVIPHIIDVIDHCETLDDLKLLTICLTNIYYVITDAILLKYKRLVERLLNSESITHDNHRVILKVLAFLNVPSLKKDNLAMIAKTLLRLKDNMHLLNVPELIFVYDIVYAYHEPADLINELQRCAIKFLIQAEDDPMIPSDIKLKLTCCSTFFTTVKVRSEFERKADVYLNESQLATILDLYRLLIFIKTADRSICDRYWGRVLQLLQANIDDDLLCLICHRYENFVNDLHYRNNEFEAKLIDLIKGESPKSIISVIPHRFAHIAAFVLAFGNDAAIVEKVSNKIVRISTQFRHNDCLFIAKGLRIGVEYSKNRFLTPTIIASVNKSLDACFERRCAEGLDNLSANYYLKNFIYRKRINEEVMDVILKNRKINETVSSVSLRNLVFCLTSTGYLVPELIDTLAAYVIENNSNILGFNAEKLLFLCYYMGYLPKNAEKLFAIAADIILRDQHRLSALSYIGAAYSLCFFNELPKSFIDNIFNVRFLDEIEKELANCYFKDIYPTRVRHSLMQLNRAVCLDYPQFNVPWFHQKYINQMQEGKTVKKRGDFYTNVNNCLLHILDDAKYLIKDQITPYGYHVDFEISVNDDDQVVCSNTENAKKLAILIQGKHCFTKGAIQLRGSQQMKHRHLEILGYKVIGIKQNAFNNFVDQQSKIDFLNSLISPKKYKQIGTS